VSDVVIREATASDAEFLRRMTYEGGFWRPDHRPDPEKALADPEIARYIPVPGREGHDAIVAMVGDEPAGCAWCIAFGAEDPGFGFAGDGIPELALAVEERFRRRGIGEALVRELLARAAARGIAQLSLSVNFDNPSQRIYRRIGFREVGQDDDSWVMVCETSGS
jgi:GNAT superfamily N-acetyltransferase